MNGKRPEGADYRTNTRLNRNNRQRDQPRRASSISRDRNADAVEPRGPQEPDLIFIRNAVFERDYGLALAGLLLTDIPWGAMLSDGDRLLIEQTLSELEALVTEHPGLLVASFWRSGVKPVNRLTPPFDCRLLQHRHRSCVSVLVTVDASPTKVRSTRSRSRLQAPLKYEGRHRGAEERPLSAPLPRSALSVGHAVENLALSAADKVRREHAIVAAGTESSRAYSRLHTTAHSRTCLTSRDNER